MEPPNGEFSGRSRCPWPGRGWQPALSWRWRVLGEFGATLMLAGNIPGRTQTIPVAIWSAVEAGDMNQALVLVLVVLVIAFGSIMAMAYWKARIPVLGNAPEKQPLWQESEVGGRMSEAG